MANLGTHCFQTRSLSSLCLFRFFPLWTLERVLKLFLSSIIYLFQVYFTRMKFNCTLMKLNFTYVKVNFTNINFFFSSCEIEYCTDENQFYNDEIQSYFIHMKFTKLKINSVFPNFNFTQLNFNLYSHVNVFTQIITHELYINDLTLMIL